MLQWNSAESDTLLAICNFVARLAFDDLMIWTRSRCECCDGRYEHMKRNQEVLVLYLVVKGYLVNDTSRCAHFRHMK